MFNHGLLHMDTPGLANQQNLIFISPVQTLDAVLRICQEWRREKVKGINAVLLSWWWWWFLDFLHFCSWFSGNGCHEFSHLVYSWNVLLILYLQQFLYFHPNKEPINKRLSIGQSFFLRIDQWSPYFFSFFTSFSLLLTYIITTFLLLKKQFPDYIKLFFIYQYINKISLYIWTQEFYYLKSHVLIPIIRWK